MNPLTAAVLAGTATGGRSFTGLAALALTAPYGSVRQPDRTLSGRWTRIALAVVAAGEIVGDKLPSTPSRLVPPVLAGRMLTAVACGAIIARRVPRSRDVGDPQAPLPVPVPVPAAATAAVLTVLAAPAAAVLSSVLGTRWRGLAARTFHTDLIGALIEDAATVAVAAAAARF